MNKKIGNNCEKELIYLLSNNGWWCHLFAYKAEGQPCDVIALKNNIPLLIDVKHCSKKRFEFSNIQVNQRNCFSLAYKKGNSKCGFAIFFELENKWKWLSFFRVLEFERKNIKGVCSEECEELIIYGNDN